jgi:hypothetical protein
VRVLDLRVGVYIYYMRTYITVNICMSVGFGLLQPPTVGYGGLWPPTASYSLLQSATVGFGLLQPPTASYSLPI